MRGVACTSFWPSRKSSKKLPPLVFIARFQRRDGVGERDRVARDLGMQQLDHAAVERDGALAFVLRLFERGDDLARRFDFFRRRREHAVAGVDLRGWISVLPSKPKARP